MNPILFTKMEGTGNDFLIIDNRNGMISENIGESGVKEFVKNIAHRQLGTGSDGVIFIEPSNDFPFHMKYFNQDGTEASLCLNGARCAVSFAHRLGLIKEKGKFGSASGTIGFYYRDGNVSIEVPPPVDLNLNFSLTVSRKKYSANFLRIGVPHCVIFVESFDDVDVRGLGRAIRNHKNFGSEGTNVDFVKAEKEQIFVRTYERGIEDETLSCGSGSLAAAYIATKLFITQSPVVCKTRGGELTATIKEKLYLEGPINYICDGVYYLK